MSSPELKNVTEVTERAKRADAVRNRQRVLDAALEAFEDAGCDCQMPEIARRAEVGVGTVYRHFPSKRDLLEALAERPPMSWERYLTLMLDGLRPQRAEPARP